MFEMNNCNNKKLVFFLTYLTPLRINQRLFYFVYLYVIDLQTTDREHLMIIKYHIDNNNFSHYAVESKILHCNNVLPPRAAYPNLKSKHCFTSERRHCFLPNFFPYIVTPSTIIWRLPKLRIGKKDFFVCRKKYVYTERFTAADWLKMKSSFLARIYFQQKFAVALD